MYSYLNSPNLTLMDSVGGSNRENSAAESVASIPAELDDSSAQTPADAAGLLARATRRVHNHVEAAFLRKRTALETIGKHTQSATELNEERVRLNSEILAAHRIIDEAEARKRLEEIDEIQRNPEDVSQLRAAAEAARHSYNDFIAAQDILDLARLKQQALTHDTSLEEALRGGLTHFNAPLVEKLLQDPLTSLAEVLSLLPEHTRPQVIPVRESGLHAISILKPHDGGDSGILIYDHASAARNRYKIAFTIPYDGGAVTTRQFVIVCGCCSDAVMDTARMDLSKDESDTARHAFVRQMRTAAHDTPQLFVRHAKHMETNFHVDGMEYGDATIDNVAAAFGHTSLLESVIAVD